MLTKTIGAVGDKLDNFVDFTDAVLSEDGTKECVNKTHFVESVEKER